MKLLSIAAHRLLLASSFILSTSFLPSALVLADSGVYKTQIGDLEIIALSDGHNQLSASFFSNTDATSSTESYKTAVNVYLVKLGEQLILIDSGNGDRASGESSLMAQALEAAGYREDEVDIVLLTHFHGDHINGLLKDDERRFTQAKVYAAKEEVAYWLSEEKMMQAPEGARASFAQAQKVLAPYQDSGQFEEFEAGQIIMDGVKSVFAPGHTPGHSGFFFDTGAEQGFLMWGDIVHNLPLQFADPEITIVFDSDKPQAIKTRREMFELVADEPVVVAGTHIDFPGMGQVTKKSDGSYAWQARD